MSQENVEIAKRWADAFNRRDLDALMETVEGMKAYFIDVENAWEEFRLIYDEYRDLGDRVLALGRIEGRGRGSGAVVETPQGAVAEFRDGKISSARSYLDHGEALRAAGLSE